MGGKSLYFLSPQKPNKNKEEFSMKWLVSNIGTIVTLLVLCIVVVLIIKHMRKNKASGKTSCGCGCENCAMHATCHGGKKV